MLKESDIRLLTPYLQAGKVINIEVKDQKNKGREVLLEYDSGKKIYGNLDAPTFRMDEVKSLTSIASYFARGKYGSNSWRGNCSGLLIKDLLQFYHPKTFADLAVGGGTSIEVAKDLGYTSSNSVFSDLNPKYGGVDISNPDIDFPLVDFIFWHPPYYVFPGSSMPVYSGKNSGGMWGDEINPHDGSRISDPVKFKRWLDQCNANLYRLLHKGGRLAILMGDSRYKGQYYSMFKNMDVYGDIEQVIVKEQHNCICDNVKYSGKFIPIEHEYLVIIKKGDPFFIPVHQVSFTSKDIREPAAGTWGNVISMILEENGGRMNKDSLIEELRKTPKAAGNNHVGDKLRQELQRHRRMFHRDGDDIVLANCAA